ncbi:MAG: hypothetical protein A3E61_01685 [Candidatus Colwellbacteria bacterium RIFCSPHIGHO2_12_FULL_43_12]|uniref:Sphingomyelin synthase-like domain-containing protein n=3 Tax=Candidatus Colwelliibacteriota TaxID=1817904 RepID=A0A1G1Z077_9BACT|nr:MAG: hypothetical protein A3D47_02380 [Candidatus Colwellbacteria bacterium RIFCSPHIGHO2_02_FULL_43_15]OGY58881.1 MAG: hypothetical protein A3E61_01685 [Candidatus Colwellbacteria bacterium RIFCSPHIGHO2_12_FULL_43_12]OGY61405.1 MAG: hypothetical protein A3F99_00270 [Candidatus Colwellbacteria bacterium RIFCSPLOWO2_12_FULL_43_11]
MTKRHLKKLIKKYGDCFGSGSYIYSLYFSITLLALSLVANLYSSAYATEKASNYVTDIILSNTQVWDVDGLFIYGPVFLWAFVLLLLLNEPKKINFTLKSVALFVFVRSAFVMATHLGPFPTQVEIDPLSLLGNLMGGGDYFFSGHTGLPFLLALLFWNNIYLRFFFVLSSIGFGAIVLLGHLHYSIDVLAAFFVTYTVYHVAESIFKKDKKAFHGGAEI